MRANKKQSKKWVKIAFFCLFFILFILLVQKTQAVWDEPSAVPPNDNIYGILTIAPDDQAKRGPLKLGAGGSVTGGYMLEVADPGTQINNLNVIFMNIKPE